MQGKGLLKALLLQNNFFLRQSTIFINFTLHISLRASVMIAPRPRAIKSRSRSSTLFIADLLIGLLTHPAKKAFSESAIFRHCPFS